MQKETIMMSLLVMTILTMTFSSAITASIGNARMILYPEVDGKKIVTIEKSILVKNSNDQVLNISLYTDSDADNFISIIDNSFLLKAGEEKKAAFKVSVRDEGRYEGKIAVTFNTLNRSEAGVALTSTIIVIAKENQDYVDIEDGNGDDDAYGEDSITGNSILGEMSGAKVLGISTVLLILVLAALVFMIKRKSKGVKRGGRLNVGYFKG